MRAVTHAQAARLVAQHCARPEVGATPRVVTSGNFASPATVLGPAARPAVGLG